MTDTQRSEPHGSRAAGAVRSYPQVPGYEILDPIARGGMGEVYLARQLSLNRQVAVKFLSPAWQADPEQDLARFRREAELMARVCHPHVLSLFDFGESDGRPYLVMAYIEGGDLRRRLERGRPLPPDQVRSLIRPVGEALTYLHRQGIVHRDLKPENILLHEGKTPLVTDFGVALLEGTSPSLTRTGHGVGTLGYVAPEQQYRLKVDERADQYSLAAVAYEMLTTQLPLGVFKPPSELVPSLGPEVDAVVLRALRENPKERYPTVAEFVAALDRALEASGRAGRGLSRRVLTLGMVLAGAVIVTTTFLAAIRYKPAAPAPPAPSPPAAAAAVAAAPVVPPPAVRDELSERLKGLVARRIWEQRGRPKGREGDAVRDAIWFEAVRQVDDELNRTAYQLWEARGSPKGPAGEAVRDELWFKAQQQLYRRLTGEEYRPDPAREVAPRTGP